MRENSEVLDGIDVLAGREPAVTEIDYQRLYSYRFRNVQQSRRDKVWAAIAPAIYERLERPRCVLDPAAGRCEFLNAVPAAERWGVDAVNHAQMARDVNTKLIVSEIMSADLPINYFDGIFISNFLEHLHSPDEVFLFLRKMWQCSKPGGRIAVMGPNFRYCASEYFDYADHWIILTERSVEEHLHAAGFRIKDVHPRFLPYSFTGRLPASPALVRAYLNFRPAWRLLGKQFLVVAERPGENEILGLDSCGPPRPCRRPRAEAWLTKGVAYSAQ